MKPSVKDALIAKLTALGDDELILAHRNSEWVGHGPILEEDIALANIVQDELGHATLWYGLRKELDGSDPDQLAFFRDANEYRCCELVELPKGDWAFTMLRQYLFDLYEALWLEAAQHSAYKPLAEAAQKIIREERFHLQHTRAWVERLGLGTEESNRRLQQALNFQWGYAQQLFVPIPGEELLVAEGIVPELGPIRERWLELVTRHLQNADLKLPINPGYQPTSRAYHTEHLWSILAEMQSTARWEPEAKVW
ncbi:1,2-phenylacetyl-CoA epoxidase, subunit C [Meiothermus luteus]|jgi:ring-1,2-phenylacetyl-CoA epoxidase subunit PaaC|uniref:1,2-phenylacetyl-CoA epoxidase, subunit C n=1 Tax=Meiothermus luteus TaxID=2026184 RepID=A0A399EES0_9DEIN|nr:1,2-phenylacetyl-CoA epoxidase subunit PaaC [Meiothermus luteus]RIH83117.1 1,2-phenylacetyl-CoA epoxidase, subunit C [Meiothermus luteus]RMH54093.1 MAG: phenylacetate-CoA oxygenase subunit PaaI [Deinococcota bacterium]